MAKKKPQEVTIEKTDYPNLSQARGQDQTFRFKGGLPGQKVEIIPIKKRPNYTRAKIRQILGDAPYETDPGCPAHGRCGGCIYQKTPHDIQHALKEAQLKDLYQDYWTQDSHLEEASDHNHYRNKMEYTFGDQVKGGPLVLGLHRRFHMHEIVDTTGCRIAPEDFEKIRAYTQDFYRERKVPYYHRMAKEGTLRHLVLRKSFREKKIMVNLVTRSQGQIYLEDYIQGLEDLDLDCTISSIYHTINDQAGDAVICDQLIHVKGDDGIHEKLLGLDFKITPFSFFQPNPLGVEKIYQKALDYAGQTQGKSIFDLYSGTGTLAQILASQAQSVYAVEIVQDAVDNAREMAKKNKLDNITFVCDDVGKALEDYQGQVDTILVDPPRVGLLPQAMKNILKAQVEKIVYISCNPKTQKDNLDQFVENGYRVEKLCAFDQFPGTVHCETVTLLSKLNTEHHLDI